MNLRNIALVTAAVAALIPSLAMAEVSASASLDYTSRYIWRGFDAYDDGAGLQPGVSVGFSPAEGLELSLGVWANYDIDYTEEIDEVDYSIDGSYALSDTISLSFGHITYDFPEGDFTTNEIYLGVAAPLGEALEGSATIYYDYDEGEGYYLTAGLSYSMELAEMTSGSLGISAGYMSYDADGAYGDEVGFSDVSMSAGVEYAITDAMAISGSLNYVYVPDEDVNEDNEFFYMVGISASM